MRFPHLRIPHIRPGDAYAWSLCHRRVWFDHSDLFETLEGEDPFAALIAEQGMAHEQAVLERLRTNTQVETATSAAHTQALMAAGVPVIYQPQLKREDLDLAGTPDFLIRSTDGAYQVADAKLARSGDRQHIRAQLGVYRLLLNSQLPAIVFQGNGEAIELDENDDAEIFLADMQAILSRHTPPDATFSQSRCSQCPYQDTCVEAFESEQALTLLYKLNRNTAEALQQLGITTIAGLAETDPEQIPDLPHLKNPAVKRRLVLQARSYLTGECFQLARLDLPSGTWVHFDVENDPTSRATQTPGVYLWGLLAPGYRDSDYSGVWALDDERAGWLEFLAHIEQLRTRLAQPVLVHYGMHERTIIRQYAQIYDMHAHPQVQWLLDEPGVLFDLAREVHNKLVLPLRGYGLKDICKHPKLVNFQWRNEDAGSQWSVVQIQKLKETADELTRSALQDYNCDDVQATRALEVWLRKNFECTG